MRPFENGDDFDGETYERDKDQVRLSRQGQVVYNVMRDGKWRTLSYLNRLTGEPEASISARLRDLRKEKFGGFDVQRRRINDGGLYEYRVLRGQDDE